MAVSAQGVNVFVRSSHGRVSKWFLCEDNFGVSCSCSLSQVTPVPVLSLSHCHGTIQFVGTFTRYTHTFLVYL